MYSKLLFYISACLVFMIVGFVLLPNAVHAKAPWYQGEWKTEAAQGVFLAVRFGVKNRGVLNLYKGNKLVGGGNITYRKSANTLIATRNGVDVKFTLNQKKKRVHTADGKAMTRIELVAPKGKGGCEEACWACNGSPKALKKAYGVSTTPKRFKWADEFMLGAGDKAFQSCIKPHGLKGLMDPIIGFTCSKKALEACEKACVSSGKSK